MFKKGYVIHYVREYSDSSGQETRNKILLYSKSISSQSFNINPNLSEESFITLTDNLPIGTIVCIDMSNDALTNDANIVVCFPLFSSHVSLPIKPGEIVWYYVDENNNFEKDVYEDAPLLSVNSFWLSRKIGAKLSEDLNYSFLPRDSLISNIPNETNSIADLIFDGKDSETKKNKKKFIEEENKTIEIPDFNRRNIFADRYSYLPDSSLIYDSTKSNSDFFPNAIPRWFSKPYELTLQGSNNSIVNLTKVNTVNEKNINKGAVDIVAGRYSLFEYIEGEDVISVKDKLVKNASDADSVKAEEIKFLKNSPVLKIKNIKNDEEIFKNQEYYFREKIIDSEVLKAEGVASFKTDASRLYVSEADDIDTSDIYRIDFLQLQRILSDNQEPSSNVLDIEKDYLIDETSVKLKSGQNKKSDFINSNSQDLPSILLKTNNVRIVARESFENKKEEKKINEGSIRLIKSSNDFINYSHIALESNGQIGITGNSILLGNFNTELIKQNILTHEQIEELEESEFVEVEKTKGMHGKGSSVLIGYDERLAEPLVLGHTLESILKEMININIQLTEELKTIADDLAKHIHIGIPTSGVSGPPQPAPHGKTYLEYSTVSQPGLKNRYENIQNNLKDILSRFAKTT